MKKDTRERDLILAYREQGMPYREIAERTGRTEQYLRTVCSKAKRKQAQKPLSPVGFCKNCGAELVNVSGTKPRQFCCDRCRYDYKNQQNQRKAYIRVCEHCGLEFVSFGYPKKRFCCRDCQTQAARKERAA